jgi:hypothetical protein
MKAEFHEGPEALERFNKGMSKLLSVPKGAVKDKTVPKLKQSVRKARKTNGKG